MDHALSTRTLATKIEGLAVGIARLAEVEPTGLVLEASEPQPIDDVARAVQASGRPVLGVLGALFSVDDVDPLAPIDVADPAAAERTSRALVETISACARLKCARLVVPVRPESQDDRAEAADRLCRRLHALARCEPGLRFLLLADAEHGSSFDPEMAGWVLEDLGLANVGVALDQQTHDGHVRWMETLKDRIGLVLLRYGEDPRLLLRDCGERIAWALRGPAT